MRILLILLGLSLVYSCKKDEPTPNYNLTGTAQKGPFVTGSNISINEINGPTLTQTGKSFSTQTINGFGDFGISELTISSNFVLLKADGYYFNENTAKISEAPLTLYSLADLSKGQEVNVNILTHLERARVEFLLKSGLSFTNAKFQAQNEILKSFGLYKENETIQADKLSFYKSSVNDAKLLAISSILQGYRTVGELSVLLANLANDLKEDGKIDEANLGSQLINHAVYLQEYTIRKHLQDKYIELGNTSLEVPYFAEYLKTFIDSSGFQQTEKLIEYPEYAGGEYNILSDAWTDGGRFAADLKPNTQLRIEFTGLEGQGFSYALGSDDNWDISYRESTNTYIFESLSGGRSCDFKVILDRGDFELKFFEMGVLQANKTRIIRH